MAERKLICWGIMALALSAAHANADEPVKNAPDAPVDDELLEFLGSVDIEDEDLSQYLARTDGASAPPKEAPQRTEPEVKKDE